MSGTLDGGKSAASKNRAIHGPDFYKRIGSLGGKAPHQGPRGFAADRELARKAGAIGGKIGKRGKSKWNA